MGEALTGISVGFKEGKRVFGNVGVLDGFVAPRTAAFQVGA